MQPIPETLDALREMRRYGDTTVARTLLGLARRVEEVVPSVVGLSLSLVVEHLTFTLTAGPPPEPGVRSSLALPLLHDGVLVAGVTLYASSPDAFEGHHEQLARACGAEPAGAVADTDLDFTTRLEAVAAPARLRDETAVDRALGAMMSRWGITLGEAERRLGAAAERASVSDPAMARTVLDVLLPVHLDDDGPPSPDA